MGGAATRHLVARTAVDGCVVAVDSLPARGLDVSDATACSTGAVASRAIPALSSTSNTDAFKPLTVPPARLDLEPKSSCIFCLLTVP